MSFTRFFYSPRFFDVTFAIIAVLMLIGIFKTAGIEIPEIAAANDPMRKGLTAVAVVICATLLASFTTKIDQKCADDFLFMALAKSALIALMAMIFTVAIYSVAFSHALMEDSLGRLPAMTLFMIVIESWTLAYFGVRWKGTRA
jgi:hypothetical protein